MRPRLEGRGFTLVEILIVVVILGILAALVIPQITRASQDAAEAATRTELDKLRRHLGVYVARNNLRLPEVAEGDGTWGQIVGDNYLHAPPTNAWVGGESSRVIVFGDAPDPEYQQTYGWIFDPVTGNVWAAGFNEWDEPYPK